MNWKIIMFAWTVFMSLAGIVAFCIIKFNDFAHIESLQKKQEGKIDDLTKDVKCIAIDVAYLCGKQNVKK